MMLARWEKGKRKAIGLFSLKGKTGIVSSELPDGQYHNLLGNSVLVENGQISSNGDPIIILIEG